MANRLEGDVDVTRLKSRKDWIALGAQVRQQQNQTGQATVPATSAACPPPNFPPEIPLGQRTYQNWALAIAVPSLWTASPLNAEQVEVLARWAAAEGYTLRARGQSHNWSPLLVPNGTDPCSKVLLVDTSALSWTSPVKDGQATFGAGTTLDTITAFLEAQNNGGEGPAPGYSFVNMTGPGDLSLGGMLAIGAHGTSVPLKDDPQSAYPFGFGCMSNLVTAFQAVVTDPTGPPPPLYTRKKFSRSDPGAEALLAHLGRALLTEATLKVVPNYYLQVRNWYPSTDVLFQAPSTAPSSQSLAGFLDTYGRVEVIWFPFTSNPWVKTWQYQEQRIEPQVTGPYNYPWANNISVLESDLIKAALFAVPCATPAFGAMELAITQVEAPEGEVMNGTSRDLLLYVKPTTLRVTAYGYAILIRRQDVQQVAHTLCSQYSQMLESYKDRNEYPVNGPVEIRFTSADQVQGLGIADALPPAIAATHSFDPSLDTVFWFDSLTLPGTTNADAFYQELESWMAAQWGTPAVNTMRPEWSKGWAYGPAGAWTDRTILTESIPAHYDQPAGSDVWGRTRKILAGYDQSRLYRDALLDLLLPFI